MTEDRIKPGTFRMLPDNTAILDAPPYTVAIINEDGSITWCDPAARTQTMLFDIIGTMQRLEERINGIEAVLFPPPEPEPPAPSLEERLASIFEVGQYLIDSVVFKANLKLDSLEADCRIQAHFATYDIQRDIERYMEEQRLGWFF